MPNSSAENRARLVAAMQRLADGERDALRDIYDATHRKLFGICLRILDDRKEAEDALQDVYLTLWRRADRFDPARASPISWLATFARNRAIDRLRRNRARTASVPVEQALDIPDEAPRADALLEDAEQSARIHHCLDQLEDPARTSIRQAFFRGQTYAQLAEAAGEPLGTVKSRIRRGLAKLRACLEGDGDDHD